MPTTLRAGARVAPLVLVLTLLGCAGTGGSGGGIVQGSGFPSAREVERLENAPAPDQVLDEDLRRVRTWRIESPVPKRIDPRSWVQRDPWGKLLGSAVATRQGQAVPTRAMHCVARELARFLLVEGGRPDSTAFRFLLGGCNASVSNASLAWVEGELGEAEDEDDVFGRWGEQALVAIENATASGGPQVIGIGFVRRGARGAVVVAYGRSDVVLEPAETRLARGDAFELRGRVRGEAESIVAMINRGRFGVAECVTVGNPVPPAFHFRCAPDPADRSAWVSLIFNRPGRFLSTQALDALVWPTGGGDVPEFRRYEYTAPRRITDLALFTSAVREDLNEVRARAKVPPLEIEIAQSATASRVAPHLFAATVGEADEQVADLAALGLLAGWDVEGMIRSGGLAFTAVPDTDDLALLLSAALEEPLSRSTLLDPEATRLAVGSLSGDLDGIPYLAAVFTSFVLFDADSRDGDADELFARLSAARQGRERRAPYRLVRVWMDAMQAAERVSRGEEAKYVMDDLLEQSVDTLQSNVSGWWAETSALEDFEFPQELIDAPVLGTAIGVSHRKGPEDAWGRYLVVVVSVSR